MKIVWPFFRWKKIKPTGETDEITLRASVASVSRLQDVAAAGLKVLASNFTWALRLILDPLKM